MTWTVGTSEDDKYGLYFEGRRIATFDDENFPGSAEPNRSRAEAVCEAMSILEHMRQAGITQAIPTLVKAGLYSPEPEQETP